MPAISVRWAMRCSRRWGPSRRSTARPSRRTAAPSSSAICSSATCCCRTRSMRHHPLKPMTDASLVRVLARQTKHKVGLVPLKQVQAGSATPARRARQARGRRRAPCRGRCRGRHRSRHHRRGGRRRPAGHRRLGRGAGPARRLSPPRPAGAQGQCRHAAQGHRRRRRARGLVLGGDAGPDRGLQGPAPSSRHRRHLPRRAGRRRRRWPGPRTSSATARSCSRPATSRTR